MPNDPAELSPEPTSSALPLKQLREFWQSPAPFDPRRALESLETRFEHGKELRKVTPREAHAEWTPSTDRVDPVETVLASNAGRLEQLIPLRMGRMAQSPFAFYRGACAVMAGDLARTPITGTQVVIGGDAHLGNFGLYGTPQRDVVIDINDFDEGTIGPWEWDLKRLAASVNVAGRGNGLDVAERREVVRHCVGGYAHNARRLMHLGILPVWSLFAYAELKRNLPELKRLGAQFGESVPPIIRDILKKARRKHNEALLKKVVRPDATGQWRFVEDPPILMRTDPQTRGSVIASLVEYGESLSPEYRFMLHRYSAVDVCHRVVGLGSVGLRSYLVLLFGNGVDDPLFLQVKEATAPAHARYLPPVAFRVQHEGRRVVAVQRGLQALGDPLLGYTTIDGRPYYVRQMKNLKGSMPLEALVGAPFDFWGWVCGMLLARAHARTGDIAKIAGYIGKSDVFIEALADFAEHYGDQTQNDHAALVSAIASGRVEAIHEQEGASKSQE
ncbi:MAG: DUF2252 domain-containing protein [Planctomycetales bacterium]